MPITDWNHLVSRKKQIFSISFINFPRQSTVFLLNIFTVSMYVILPNPPKLFFKSPLGNFGKVIEFQLYTWLLNVLLDQNYYLFTATLKSFSWIEYLYPLAFKCSSQWYASKFLKEINHRGFFFSSHTGMSFL